MQLPFLCAGAAKGIFTALAATFTAQTGVEPRGAFGAVGSMKEKFLAGEPCDLIILTAALIDSLEAAGDVVPGTASPLGRVRTGIAARAGDPLPAIADAAALSSALAAAAAIYLPDPQRATAGIHFVDVLKRLDLYAAAAPRLRVYPSGAVAMRELADAPESGCLGCTQISEILYTSGVTLVGPLPPGFDLATVYAVAVSTRARQPELARQFAMLLSGPGSRSLRTEGGFEV